MKIDFSKSLIGLNGLPVKDNNEILTLGSVSVNALVSGFSDEKINGGEKFKRYQIAQKIYDKSEVDISLDDIVLIKSLIGKAYSPVVVGPAFTMLEKGKKK